MMPEYAGTMDDPRDRRGDAKLQTLIHHLVRSFPQTSILSRQVGNSYHMCVIVPHNGAPEKTIQVERALLVEPSPSLAEFAVFLTRLDLSRVLEGCARYDLRQAMWTQAQTACLRAQAPANA